MLKGARELWLALVAILFITSVYFLIMTLTDGVPAASGLYGHAMGILGFILMLMTEILYSLRKRSRNARWGKMSSWLEFHIFTGLVGPYLVLLHTSWKFNGVAGVLMLMTVIIVASGFIGRYIYTVVPRSADGVELEVGQLESEIGALEAELQSLFQAGSRDGTMEAQAAAGMSGAGSQGVVLVQKVNSDDKTSREKARKVDVLLKQRTKLTRQLNSIANSRKILATWHTVHVPIGLALFCLAAVHIVAAVYYATLLK